MTRNRIYKFYKAEKCLMCRTCALTSSLTKLLLTSKIFRSRSHILCHSNFLETKPRYFLRSQSGHYFLSRSQTRILCPSLRRIIITSAIGFVPKVSKPSTLPMEDTISALEVHRHCRCKEQNFFRTVEFNNSCPSANTSAKHRQEKACSSGMKVS